MKFNFFSDAFDDAQHSLDERAAIAARSTWVSVGVNLMLTVAQVGIGVLNLMTHIDPWRKPDLDYESALR